MSPRARRQTQIATPTLTPPAPIDNAAPVPVNSPESRFERIAQRAYSLYERRGGQDGESLEDWLQAEREIDSEA